MRAQIHVWSQILLLLCIWPLDSHAYEVSCTIRYFPSQRNPDIIFPAIFGLRSSSAGSCGYISLESLQVAVALNWAAELLNGDIAAAAATATTTANETHRTTTSFIPGVRIGVPVYDDCEMDFFTAKYAGQLIANAHGFDTCTSVDNQNRNDTHVAIAGFLGSNPVLADAVHSTNFLVVGTATSLSPELTDTTIYRNYLKTVPSYLDQAKVIVQVAKQYKWSYVVGLHTTDEYGTQGMKEIRRLAKRERICISTVHTIDVSSPPPEHELQDFVRQTLFSKVNKENIIGVIYFGYTSGLEIILKYMADKRSEWFSSAIYLSRIFWITSDGVTPTSTYVARELKSYSTEAVIVAPPAFNVASFKDYFRRFFEDLPDWAEGPWKTALSDCRKTGSNQPCVINSEMEYSRNLTVALDSIYLLASMAKEMHTTLCNGQPGLCEAMKVELTRGNFRQYSVHELNYTSLGPAFAPPEFIAQNRRLVNTTSDNLSYEAVNQVTYDIVANVKEDDLFSQIGTVIDGVLSINSDGLDILPISECPGECSECFYVDSMKFLFSPGDVIILGIYSIHWNGGPFACGSFREDSSSYVAMTAFLSCVEWLRNEYKDHNFGYLVLDDCYDPLVANSMLIKVLSGDWKITDNATGIEFDPSKVVVGVGAQSSPVTMASVNVLQRLEIPLISYSASNPNLDNRITYPYFSRTSSSDRIQAKVLYGILKALKVSHVGAIAIQNSYGLELYQLFREIAENNGICVENVFEITTDTSIASVRGVLTSYRQRNIHVVITIAMDSIVTKILQAAIPDDTFVFVGSEAWGPNEDIIEGVNGERARGSLVLALPSFPVDYGLKNYIYSMDPFTDHADPWLREFWQDQLDCDLPGGFRNTRTKSCSKDVDLFSDTILDSKLQVPLTVHSTYATISAGLAVNKMVADGKRRPYDPKELTDTIRDVELVKSNGEKFKPFLSTGNGNGGFVILNVQQDNGRYHYVKVGEATGEGAVSLDLSAVKFYGVTGNVVSTVVSTCIYRPECKEVCPPIGGGVNGQNSTSSVAPPAASTSEKSTDSALIGLGIICGLLFLVLLAFIILAILFCQGRLGWNNKYISAGSMNIPHYVAPSHTSHASHASSTARSQASAKDENGPPLPPSRKKSDASREGISNKGFSDIQGDVVSLQAISASNGSLNTIPGINTANLPPPKPHAVVYPATVASQKSGSGSGSASSGSVSQSKRSASPAQAVQPMFYVRLEDHPTNETQLKFSRVESFPMLVSLADGQMTRPPFHTSLSTPAVSSEDDNNVLSFNNMKDGEMYKLDDLASGGSLRNPYKGENCLYVKTADGRLVPYENVAQTPIQDGSLAYSNPNQQILMHPLDQNPPLNQVMIDGKMYYVAVGPHVTPSNNVVLNSPGSNRQMAQIIDSGLPVQGQIPMHAGASNAGYSTEDLHQMRPKVKADNLANPPNAHARHSKYQDDYITAIDAPEHGSEQKHVVSNDNLLRQNSSEEIANAIKTDNRRGPHGESDVSSIGTRSRSSSVKDSPKPVRPQHLPISTLHTTQGQDVKQTYQNTGRKSPAVSPTRPDGMSGFPISATIPPAVTCPATSQLPESNIGSSQLPNSDKTMLHQRRNAPSPAEPVDTNQQPPSSQVNKNNHLPHNDFGEQQPNNSNNQHSGRSKRFIRSPIRNVPRVSDILEVETESDSLVS